MFRSASSVAANLRHARPLTSTTRRTLSYSSYAAPSRRIIHSRYLWAFGAAVVASAATLTAQATTSIHLDAEVSSSSTIDQSEDFVVDEDTSVAFPKVLKVQSRTPLPAFTLVGVGVRTVSFLGIRVYSVGFYADLANPRLKIPVNATPEEKIEHIIQNSACLLRIVPTRSTNFTHLRDGFVRAVQARLAAFKVAGKLTPTEEYEAQAPIRQLKTLFPNTPLAKGTPLDIILTPPEPTSNNRSLIFRDLGVVYDPWVSREFVLAYFEGKGISPPLKNKVVAALENFGSP